LFGRKDAVWSLVGIIAINATINNKLENGDLLFLKRSLLHIENVQLVSKIAFTQQSLTWATKTGPTQITGRTLLHLANKALDNLKKANTHALSYLGPDGQVPSAKTEGDLDNFVLEKMFTDLNGRHTLDEADQADDDDDFDALWSDKKEEWYFNGWFAFTCFGPMALDA
jgi:hypothetical protein